MAAFNEFLLQSGATDGAFLQMMGEVVIRWPRGVEASAINVTAIVDRDEEAQLNKLQAEQLDHIRDRQQEGIAVVCRLDVPVSVETDYDDLWVVDGQIWKAPRVYGRDAGMKSVLLERWDGRYTARGGRII